MRGSLRRRDRRQDKNGPERWELRAFLGRDEQGQQHRLSRAFTGTRREAETALAAFVTEVERGRQSRSSKTPFGEYARQWLASRDAAGELAAKTLERYRGIVDHHLIPQLGAVALGRLSVGHVRKALGVWRNGGRRDRKTGPLSEKSVHDHFALLKQILGEAVRERLIVDNQAAFVRAPGKGGSRRRTYTMHQLVALVDYLRPTPLATPVLVKALSGLRRGELLALRWRYLDLETGELHVHESLERRRDGPLRFKQPKTAKSDRLIVLPACALEELQSHYVRQRAMRNMLGLDDDSDLVFCDPDGAAWDPDAFSSAFAYQISKSALPRISLQELRHSYSSISQRLGTPLTTTSQSMGHSTTTITGDRYTQALLEDFHASAARIDRAFRSASQSEKIADRDADQSGQADRDAQEMFAEFSKPGAQYGTH